MKDGSGGWPQLGFKLANNDLDFRGCKVPKVKTAVMEAIRDLHEGCVEEGATDLELPTQPLTYSGLITRMKELGLISPPPPPSGVPEGDAAGVSRAEHVEQQQQALLLGTHRTEV